MSRVLALLIRLDALEERLDAVKQSARMDRRCARPDGTFYGTRGECRKGKPAGDRQATARIRGSVAAPNTKARKPASPGGAQTKPKTEKASKPQAGRAQSQQKPTLKNSAAKTKGGRAKNPKEEYAALVKKQQQLVQKGDIQGAMSLRDKIKAAADKIESSPEAQAQKEKLKKEAESKAERERNFKKAQKRRNDGQLAAGLTARDRKVIADYTKETLGQSARSYGDMNGCLRLPPTCPDLKTSKRFVKEFDAALAKLPRNDQGDEFFRGIQVRPGQTQQLYDALKNAKPGTKMKDPGYGSYSAEKRQAERFTNPSASNIIFVTRNKSITPINMFSEIKAENEAILPRGTEQTIRKVTQKGKNLIVELD